MSYTYLNKKKRTRDIENMPAMSNLLDVNYITFIG